MSPRAARMALATSALLVSGCGSGAMDAVTLEPNALSSALLAHWAFDEGAGGAVADSSGNGYHGRLNGSTWSWVDPARFAAGVRLQQGDYVSVDGFPYATVGWTVAAWVKVPTQAVGLGELTVISTEDVYKGGWEVNLTALAFDKRYHFGFWTGPTEFEYTHFECVDCLRTEVWQHVAAVVDGKNESLAFYLDGVLQGRQGIPQPISPGVSTLYMGRWATAEPARLLMGSLDDVGIWQRALSSAEIALLAQAPVP